MKTLGTSIMALVLCLSMFALVGCEEAEQAFEEAKPSAGSVIGGTDNSDSEIEIDEDENEPEEDEEKEKD